VRYDWAPVLRLTTLTALATVAARFVPRLDIVASLAVHALMFALYLVVAWFVGGLTASDKVRARSVAGRLWTRLRSRLRSRLQPA
jgi:hypothetical protein